MEGILCAKHSIGYLPLPKVANTSLKHMMFEMENGVRFRAAATGSAHIHDYFRQHRAGIAGAAFRFVVVRDPIRRFLSAYSNRVLHHRELSEEKLATVSNHKKHRKFDPGGLPRDPDLGLFIERLELFQKVPSIMVHTRPVSDKTGPLGFFSKVYPFECLPQLQSDLSEIIRGKVFLRHSQSGGPKLPLSLLDRAQMEKLCTYYKDDYQLLEPIYPVSRIWSDWQEARSC